MRAKTLFAPLETTRVKTVIQKRRYDTIRHKIVGLRRIVVANLDSIGPIGG